jgi:hypothetical protein
VNAYTHLDMQIADTLLYNTMGASALAKVVHNLHNLYDISTYTLFINMHRCMIAAYLEPCSAFRRELVVCRGNSDKLPSSS